MLKKMQQTDNYHKNRNFNNYKKNLIWKIKINNISMINNIMKKIILFKILIQQKIAILVHIHTMEFMNKCSKTE